MNDTNTNCTILTLNNEALSSFLSPYTVAPSSFDRCGALRLPITMTYGMIFVYKPHLTKIKFLLFITIYYTKELYNNKTY